MSDRLVFVGENKTKYPNIHGEMQHYNGKYLLTQKKTGESFRNIESRYLNTIKMQLTNQQTKLTEKEYLNSLSIAQFKKLENEIESQISAQYNEVANQIGTAYTKAVAKFESTLKNSAKSKKDALLALNDLIQIFSEYEDSASLIQSIKYPEIQTSTTVNEILRLKNFIKLIEDIKDNGMAFDAKRLSSILTQPSEAASSLIDIKAKDISNNEVLKYLQASLQGTKSFSQKISFGKEDKTIQNMKPADLRLVSRYIKFSERATENNQGITFDYELEVTPFASVKVYRSKNEAAQMISYGGKNSIVIPVLHKIYGNSDESNYKIYNALAFSSYKTQGPIDTNYRIIRSDVIAELAEKYIVGFTTTQSQQLIIHNFRAYPTLSIITAIAQQAIEKTKGGNSVYGSLGEGDIFSISFDTGASNKINNEYIGTSPNNSLKQERIKRVKAAIDGLVSQGKLDFKNFQKYIESKKYKVSGLSLKNIIPGS